MDKGKSCAVLLIDLSKVFDCIVNNFFIAKLEAYGTPYTALKVMIKPLKLSIITLQIGNIELK